MMMGGDGVRGEVGAVANRNMVQHRTLRTRFIQNAFFDFFQGAWVKLRFEPILCFKSSKTNCETERPLLPF